MSSKKETIERSKQNPKIIFQLLLNVSSNKKITDVENKISGINIIPAPRGFGSDDYFFQLECPKTLDF